MLSCGVTRVSSNLHKSSMPDLYRGGLGDILKEVCFPLTRWRDPVNFIKTIVAAGLVAASTSAFAADITGAGATFPFPLYSKWADAYKKETGNGLNYQSIGSGAGIKQIQAKTVTFGASDMPLKAGTAREGRSHSVAAGDGRYRACRESRRHQAGRTGALRRTARRHLSRQGHQTWNDPAIVKLNPKLTLPRMPSPWCAVRTARERPSS